MRMVWKEFVSDWSVKHLKDLLYYEKMEIPMDYKFDAQINQVVAVQSGTRTIYSSLSADGHLFQAFQVFSIAHWFNEFNNAKGVIKKEFFKGIT